VESLLKLESTDLVVVKKGKFGSIVYDTNGRTADIDCYNINASDWCSYRYDTTRGDPLGYSKNPKIKPLLDGFPHTPEEWLNSTCEEKYPDGVIQLSQIFRDGRAGEIFLITKPEWLFRSVKKGTHGGLHKDDMMIPFMMRGPEIQKGKYHTMRAPDIYPLLLTWLGVSADGANSDGVNPFVAYKNTNEENWEKVAKLEQIFTNQPPLRKLIGLNDVLKKEIYPQVKASEFNNILILVRTEAERRNRLVEKLNDNLKEMDTKKKDPLYSEDYKNITKETLSYYKKSIHTLDDISKVLEYCKNPEGTNCRGL